MSSCRPAKSGSIPLEEITALCALLQREAIQALRALCHLYTNISKNTIDVLSMIGAVIAIIDSLVFSVWSKASEPLT